MRATAPPLIDAAKWREERSGDARVEQDRVAARLGPRRVEPGDRTLTGEPADLLRRVEVFEVARAVPGVVALHGRAFAGDHAAERCARSSDRRALKPAEVASAIVAGR